jgi:hypothetical protein
VDGKREHGQPISKTFHHTPASHLLTLLVARGRRRHVTHSQEAATRTDDDDDDDDTTTMATQTLHGACACGRNRYVVEIPAHQVQQAEVRYDNTSASRKSRCGRD